MKQAMTLTTGAAGDTAITCPCSRLVYTENHIDVVCPDCGRRYTRNVVWIMLDESPPDLSIGRSLLPKELKDKPWKVTEGEFSYDEIVGG